MTKAKIMIVEDEAVIAKDIETRLKSMSYAITSIISTGEQAVEKAGRECPDLILMDIQLKGQIDGIEAAELIRSKLEIPVIFLSAYADKQKLQRAKYTMPYGYILKPFQDRDLEVTVEIALYAAKVDAKRRESEEALRQSREKYQSLSKMLRLMCDNVPDMIWAKDLEKRYTFANKAVCRDLLNAVDTDEPIGKNDLFFAEREKQRYPDNPEWHTFGEICRDTDAITMNAGVPQQFDEYGNVQGKFLFLDVHKAPFLDENGKMIGTVGSARDVTVAKEMENQLKESEERLKKVLRNMPAMMDAFDENGVAIMWNHECELATGYSAEEIIGNPAALELLMPDPSYRNQMIEELFRKGGNYRNWEWTVTCKDGTQKIISWSNISKDYPIQGWAGWGIGIDITERKNIEKALENAKNQWEKTFDAITDWVCIIDKDCRIIRSNNASINFIGIHPRNIVGKHCFEIVHGSNNPVVDCPMKRSFKTRQREQFEFQDRKGRWMHVLVDPINGVRNNSGYMVHVMRDITSSKIREQKIFSAMKAEAFRILAGGLAHDYNNLLMAIWGNISLLKYETDKARQQEFIEEAENACELARSLTHQFITLSKGAMINKTQCDIKEVIDTAVKSAVKTENINVCVNNSSFLPMIELDLQQMHIVFHNIIINAVEAMPEGGTLNVGIKIFSKKYEDQKEVSFLQISFKDTGPGIPKSDLSKVFDPYFTTKTMGAQKGVGLGLAAAQAIVANHGGNIYIESALGKGTTVIVILPIDKLNSRARSELNILYPTTEKPVVLIMENNLSLRKLIERMLRKLNCEVLLSGNEKELIEIYQLATLNDIIIDLIILSHSKKNGAGVVEALSKMRNIGYDKKAIIITGSPDSPYVKEFGQYGFDGVLLKPYTKKELENVIRRCLSS
jgi:two-component system, cell cycle sensor histidine kinase and response regulator CckA